MRARLIKRLQASEAQLKAERQIISENAIANAKLIDAMGKATWAAIEAPDFPTLLEILTSEWPAMLDVDVIALGAEAELLEGIQRLPFNSVQTMLGDGTVTQAEKPAARDGLYGAATPLVSSDAIVRLNLGAPAVIAFGSGTEGTFHEGQATDVVHFLAGVVERLIKPWLKAA